MARILSVTFETDTQRRPGAFSVPRAAAELLRLHADDPVQLRVTWEGGKLELDTRLRSGFEVYPRAGDASTAGLEAIPGATSITVTVWRSGEADLERGEDSADWTDERFEREFAHSGASVELLMRLRRWAQERGIAMRYGRGKTSGPLYFEIAESGRRTGLARVGATGGIGWDFQDNLDSVGALKNRSARVEFVRRIGELFDVDRPDERADRWVEVTLIDLPPNRHDALLHLLDDELELIRRGPSELATRYQRTFAKVLNRFKKLRPDATATQSVAPQNWLEFSAGKSGFLFAWAMVEGRHFRAELYIDVGNQSKNKRIFDSLRERSTELEGEVGQSLTWERLDAKRGSRVAVYYDHLRDDFENDEALTEWAAQTMARLVDVFRPVIRSLDV